MRRRRRHRMGSEMLPAAAPLDRIDDNILSEILLRLPPQPSSLPRASAVSKRWHGLASDPDFCRRFRRHHRSNAPLLGFFNQEDCLTFVPTLDAPNRVLPGRFSMLCDDRNWYVLCGSRHGLVLMLDFVSRHILVLDPVTGDRYRAGIPLEFALDMDSMMDNLVSGAVLRDAGDVHFRVVLVEGDNKDRQDSRALARVYSSETNLWGNPCRLHAEASLNGRNPAVLVGDSLYWQLCGSSSAILEFNLERQSLNVIHIPEDMYDGFFSVIREDSGGLGLLSLSDFTAQLWKRKTHSDGVLGSWVLGRTIELDKLLSLNPAEHKYIWIRGLCEENNVVFLSTVIGLFIVQLHSLQFTFIKNTETTDIDSCHPFQSVYTAGT